MMFFDPMIMAETVYGILKLKNAQSLEEAERIFYEDLGELPESRLLPTVRYFKEPSV